ncbi:MAG: hypothetical protein KAR37_13175 [Alphaproteobacteria bacterium]|nr:hypothetical protein [Alphaproteobacteria bacterium]
MGKTNGEAFDCIDKLLIACAGLSFGLNLRRDLRPDPAVALKIPFLVKQRIAVDFT